MESGFYFTAQTTISLFFFISSEQYSKANPSFLTNSKQISSFERTLSGIYMIDFGFYRNAAITNSSFCFRSSPTYYIALPLDFTAIMHKSKSPRINGLALKLKIVKSKENLYSIITNIKLQNVFKTISILRQQFSANFLTRSNRFTTIIQYQGLRTYQLSHKILIFKNGWIYKFNGFMVLYHCFST